MQETSLFSQLPLTNQLINQAPITKIYPTNCEGFELGLTALRSQRLAGFTRYARIEISIALCYARCLVDQQNYPKALSLISEVKQLSNTKDDKEAILVECAHLEMLIKIQTR